MSNTLMYTLMYTIYINSSLGTSFTLIVVYIQKKQVVLTQFMCLICQRGVFRVFHPSDLLIVHMFGLTYFLYLLQI